MVISFALAQSQLESWDLGCPVMTSIIQVLTGWSDFVTDVICRLSFDAQAGENSLALSYIQVILMYQFVT